MANTVHNEYHVVNIVHDASRAVIIVHGAFHVIHIIHNIGPYIISVCIIYIGDNILCTNSSSPS